MMREAISQDVAQAYFGELAIRLPRTGVAVGTPKDGFLPIEYDGANLCRVNGKGDVLYHEADAEGRERQAALHRVIGVANEVDEYMRLMEKAPHLEATGLSGDYRILADFRNTVLAGHPTKHGIQFITWEWSFDRTGVGIGHYFEQDYAGAKRDFAIRAGMIDRDMLLTPEQSAEVYRAIHETLDGEYAITDERKKLLETAAEQIERTVPDLDRRVAQSNRQELELNMESGQTMC